MMRKKKTPTQQIKDWIEDFVTQPNPVFGDLPPCPFARKAILDGKVEFRELDGAADYGTLYAHIYDFDFEQKDVLVLIAGAKQFTAKQTKKLAKDLNTYYMPRDVVVLEDHPDIEESIAGVKLNNGMQTLFLVQRLSKLNKFSDILKAGPYYKNWPKKNLKDVVTWRKDP